MLTLLRNLLRSKIALLIIGLLIVAMASFGITDIFAPNLGSSLVAVGNRTVEANDVERDADSYLNRLSDSGTYLTKQDLAEGGQLQAILDQLVSRNLLAAYLQDQGIATSEEELIAYIRQLPIFRNAVTQGFSQDAYLRFLNDRRQSESEFRQDLSDDLTFSMVNSAFSSALRPPAGVSELLTIFDNEERRIAYMLIMPEDLPEPVAEPTEEELRAFFDERSGQMLQPERRAFSVIAVRPDDFTHQVEVSEEEIAAQFQAQESRFRAATSRTFERIVFANEANALRALGSLLGGEDEQTIISSNGGNVIPPQTATEGGIANPEISDLVFGTPENVWTGPVELPSGQSALIRVTDITLGELTPLEEVSATLRAEIVEYKAEQMYEDSFDLIDDAVGSGGSLDEISEMIGSPVHSYAPVDDTGRTRDGTVLRGLTAIDGALEFGFQLFPDETSFREDAGLVQYIIRLDDTVPSYLPDFDEMRDEIAAVVYQQNVQTALSELSDGIVSRLNESSFLSQEAEALGLEVARPPVAIRRDSGAQIGFPDAAMVRIFSAELDHGFVVPLQRGVFIGVVESIDIPTAEELTSLMASTNSGLTQLLASEFDGALFGMAQDNISFRQNDAAISAYFEQYQAQQ
ncbi:peptidylprolyl isomerase [Ponticaulis sp.]|uniref:peptidylprolyl isomerase n=1 Tax=Ponticaulis sp. TaxID=2020902 RepID=UPI000B6B28BA|nr:peptidylprolyl isomerase [Ponticaulis sp.]MAI89423.1 hypothetical protein [Ponticaulis sp.]OUY00461.1 MAG: hypothetical protein CBB65_03195 [Hyphomonadaceae bacterium TMED5]|tara:strand:+ start:68201 stop:70099 length:1899 start_codon:yes stop_codon:yes gene_type:complete